MSYVAYRTKDLPQTQEMLPSIAREGEQNLAEIRSERLARWRTEKLLKAAGQPETPSPAATPKKEAPKEVPG